MTSSLPSLSLRESVRLGISKRTDFPLVLSKCALLVIDVQRYCCEKSVSDYYDRESLPRMLRNIELLVDRFREERDQNVTDEAAGNDDGNATREPPNDDDDGDGAPRKVSTAARGCEVIFVMIRSSTKDGRDMSLDYKLSGPSFRKIPTVEMAHGEIFMPSLQPDCTSGRGDIVIPKTACSVFNSTNLDYVLRNLFIEQLVVCGQLTDQCVESAVRDAADLGYLVTVVEDACAAHSKEWHDKGLMGMQGFSRICTTSEIDQEIQSSPNGSSHSKQQKKKRRMSSKAPSLPSYRLKGERSQHAVIIGDSQKFCVYCSYKFAVAKLEGEDVPKVRKVSRMCFLCKDHICKDHFDIYHGW